MSQPLLYGGLLGHEVRTVGLVMLKGVGLVPVPGFHSGCRHQGELKWRYTAIRNRRWFDNQEGTTE